MTSGQCVALEFARGAVRRRIWRGRLDGSARLCCGRKSVLAVIICFAVDTRS